MNSELVDAQHHPFEERAVADERPSASVLTYRVMVGMTCMGVSAGSHWRTLVEPWPIEAMPMGTR
jgi:hypothetical protein